jgi:3-methyladenine DNA glycosylase Mpg
MSKRITNKEFFEKDAIQLAQDLLGKVICYDKEGNEIRYMITVTEAYPYDDYYSYVNREQSGFSHDCLLKEENESGDCFINYNGIHILGSLGNDSRRFNHILIRGGIKIEKSDNQNEYYKLNFEHAEMNLKYGRPTILMEKLFDDKLEKVKNRKYYLLDKSQTNIWLEDYKRVEFEAKKRIGLTNPDKLETNKAEAEKTYDKPFRYYFYPNNVLIKKKG